MNSQPEKPKRPAEAPLDEDLRASGHKKPRVFLLTNTDKKRLSEVEVIKSMKEIPVEATGKTRIEFTVDALNVLEGVKIDLEEEKERLVKRFEDLKDENALLKVEKSMFDKEAKILKRRAGIHAFRKEILAIEVQEVTEERRLLEEKCVAIEDTKVFFKKEKISAEKELENDWDKLPFWDSRGMQEVNQCLEEVNEMMDRELGGGDINAAEEDLQGMGTGEVLDKGVVSEDSGSRSEDSICQVELSAENGLLTYRIVNSPDGSFDSSEVESASSPVATNGSQTSASSRSVMFDTLVRMIREEDDDGTKAIGSDVTGQLGAQIRGDTMEVVTGEELTLTDANLVSKVERPDCFGVNKADPAVVVIKFRKQQDGQSRDSRIGLSSDSANDSVLIIDSE